MSETFTRDKLFVNGEGVLGREEIIVLGAGALVRGTVLGKITLGAATGAVTKGAGVASGTGNGVLGSITKGVKAKLGVYKLTCSAAATDSGTFTVVDPDGYRLPDATVAVAYTNPQINFTIADGSADFAVADQFTITVAAGSGSLTTVLSTNVDGSQYPYAVLAEAVDATSAAKNAAIYTKGVFNESALTFGGSDTIATHRAAMRAIGLNTEAYHAEPA